MVMMMYFDPGTGSLIIQMLLACVAGITSFFVMFKTNIIAFFSKKKEKKSTKVKKEVTKK
jgi:hypothetical protein